ncbi:hypothetical protein [Nocardia cyriacigeorgica]|uniref:hypothetical protein n=1 Tax=Nocardia cyriacigeorgica TaxID=135487 RepID=UPI001894E660|nr:hypothetical protein [Nocardia cyriacigeorgica]MBF6453440.1 hypothetical protein [Nocardia cyriacigeorgica]MBF6477143.1 hypothetical protein [Nocardia cyriacigeorgica]MBF6550609.1 hypothetical protein [Nocardia cyriacigeorgica]
MYRRPTSGSPRGFLVGASAGALAVAAHGLAGGAYPSSAELALILIAASVTGLAAAARPMGWGSVLVWLAAGQAGGHVALTGLYGHEHASPTAAAPAGELLGGYLPSGPMLLAHFTATAVCAALIPLAERLYRAVSAAVRIVVTAPRTPFTHRPPNAGVAIFRLLGRSPIGAVGPRAPPLARPA